MDRSSHYSHLNHLQRLAATFRRPITGIHKQAHGPILDLFHAFASTFLPSATTIPLVSQLRLALLSPQARKVILSTHGTGTISMNAALGGLHADLPLVCMSKLEIYIFGAASRHINDPLLVLDELSRLTSLLPMPSNHSSSRNGAPQEQQERSRSRSRCLKIHAPMDRSVL